MESKVLKQWLTRTDVAYSCKHSRVAVQRNQFASRDFKGRDWTEVREFVGGMAERSPDFQYLVDILDSIITLKRTSDFNVTTSMHDLILTTNPVPEPPFDVIAIRAPGSLHPADTRGNVLIEHLAVSGHNDRIERPPDQAVPLFWRFAIEKFGVIPPQRPQR